MPRNPAHLLHFCSPAAAIIEKIERIGVFLCTCLDDTVKNKFRRVGECCSSWVRISKFKLFFFNCAHQRLQTHMHIQESIYVSSTNSRYFQKCQPKTEKKPFCLVAGSFRFSAYRLAQFTYLMFYVSW